MIHGSGFGKVILFGEHFVVHGLPAIVASLEQSTTATITLTPGQPLKLIDHRPFAPGTTHSSEKAADYLAMTQRIVEFLLKPSVVKLATVRTHSISHQRCYTQGEWFKSPFVASPSSNSGQASLAAPFVVSEALAESNPYERFELSITLAGTLAVTNGGIGASAAAAVSIAQGINNYFSLGYTHEDIYAAALHGEKAIHGNPSGVDVAAALNGGITCFAKNSLRLKHPFTSPMAPTKNPLFFVIIDSRQRCAIKEVLSDVATLRSTHPTLFASLCAAYSDLINGASKALRAGDVKKLGSLMLENQQLLESLTLSHPAIDTIIKQALNLGAYGVKLTGTGRGGLVIALAPNEIIQQRMVMFFKKQGNHVMKATLPDSTLYDSSKKMEAPCTPATYYTTCAIEVRAENF